jgi:hypothetical protein
MNQPVRVGACLLGAALLVACSGDGAAGPGADEFNGNDVYQVDDTKLGEVPQPEGCLGTLWVPSPEPGKPGFDFAMRTGVVVDVAIVHGDGQPWPGVMVMVFDTASDVPAEMTLLEEGPTDDAGLFSRTVALPAEQSAVRVVGSFMGAKNWAVVPVVDGRASVELGRDEP